MEEMSYKKTRYQDLIDRFSESQHVICKVEVNTRDIKEENVATCINVAAKRFNKTHIRAFNYKGVPYVVNELKVKNGGK